MVILFDVRARFFLTRYNEYKVDQYEFSTIKPELADRISYQELVRKSLSWHIFLLGVILLFNHKHQYRLE